MWYLIILWALVGWTGIVWPPHPPGPTKLSNTEYGWITERFFNMIGAVIGGMFWNWIWPVGAQISPGVGAGMSCIGALIGASLAADLVWLLWRQPGEKAAEVPPRAQP